MYFKTEQGQIRLTTNMNGGILMTVDDDENEQQAKAGMSISTAERFAAELVKLINTNSVGFSTRLALKQETLI